MATAASVLATPTVQAVDIVEYGTYRIQLAGEHLQVPSAAAGVVEPASRARLIATTNQVPAVVGTTFGCHFVIKGEPIGTPVMLDIVVEHPAFRKPGGETTGTTDKVPWQYVIGRKVGYTYTFDNAWEAVPGVWAIQVWHEGKRLAEQKFIVTTTAP